MNLAMSLPYADCRSHTTTTNGGRRIRQASAIASGRRLALRGLLETLEHRRPVFLGHLVSVFLSGIVVLPESERRLAVASFQDVGERVVVLGLVLAAAHRAPVCVLQHSLRLDLENLALVLVRLPFPFARPLDRAALFPIGRHLGAVHVLLYLVGIGQRIPNVGSGSVDRDFVDRFESSGHRYLLLLVLSPRAFKHRGQDPASAGLFR